jgi:L-fuconolactonase
MRIDAHLHFWRPSCGFDNRPVADHPAYRRDFLPRNVAADVERSAIDGVLLVQTCPQAEETAWLLGLANEHDGRFPPIVGITGWVDLDDAACDFSPLLAQPSIVGVRAQLRRIADPAFIERPRVLRNLGAAIRAGLGVTILAEPRHYASVARALEALPPGPITLNHLGLRFPDTDPTRWRAAMRGFAHRDAVFVQLSGLPFLYGERWRDDDARRVLDEAFDILGPSRLMFASDWPMLVRFASYTEWVQAVDAFLLGRGATRDQVDAIFEHNVRRANPRLSLPTLTGTST